MLSKHEATGLVSAGESFEHVRTACARSKSLQEEYAVIFGHSIIHVLRVLRLEGTKVFGINNEASYQIMKYQINFLRIKASVM